MPLMIGIAIFLAVLALLCSYFKSRAEGNGGQSTVHVAANEVEIISQAKRSSDTKAEGREEEEGQQIDNDKDNEERHDQLEGTGRKSNQIISGSVTAAAIVGSAGDRSVMPTGAGGNNIWPSSSASAMPVQLLGAGQNQNIMPFANPVGLQGAGVSPYTSVQGTTLLPHGAPSWQKNTTFVQSTSTSAEQKPGAKAFLSDTSGPNLQPKPASSSSSDNNLFKSCQQQVNLWQYIVVNANSVQRGALLGRGAYAEVYNGHALGTECAIKLYRSTASMEQRKEAMREIRLGASLDHPCTLRVLGWVQNPLQTITELCCGDLKAFYLDKIEKMQYSEIDALRLLRVGQKCCHDFSLVHDVVFSSPN